MLASAVVSARYWGVFSGSLSLGGSGALGCFQAIGKQSRQTGSPLMYMAVSPPQNLHLPISYLR